MKKICLIIGNLRGGGAERTVINLATELGTLGHQVAIIMTIENKIDYPVNTELYDIHFIGDSKFHGIAIKGLIKLSPQRWVKRMVRKFLPFYQKKQIDRLREKLKELGDDFDLVISNLPETNVLCTQAKLPNLYCCIHRSISQEYESDVEFFKKRIISYDLFSSIFSFVKKKSIQRVYRNQQLITVSEGVKEDLLAFGIKPKSVKRIYNLINFTHIRERATEYDVDEDNYIISVGRLNKEKRHDVLLKAYHKTDIPQKLLIMGGGSEDDRIKGLIEELELQERVVMKGFVKNPYPYIKKAKFLVLSSEMEGLPTVLIEALILGTPVVSTDCVSGPNEILVDELADFLSPVGDVEALAKNIKKMAENPLKITDKHLQKFDEKEILKEYINLCE